MSFNQYAYSAKVLRVVDGDTIDLDIDLGMDVHVKERVRLRDIDAPETYGVKKGSEEYLKGMETKDRLGELVLGQNIQIRTYKDKKGKYGRYLVDVFLHPPEMPAIHINNLLVEEGLAEYKKY